MCGGTADRFAAQATPMSQQHEGVVPSLGNLTVYFRSHWFRSHWERVVYVVWSAVVGLLNGQNLYQSTIFLGVDGVCSTLLSSDSLLK